MEKSWTHTDVLLCYFCYFYSIFFSFSDPFRQETISMNSLKSVSKSARVINEGTTRLERDFTESEQPIPALIEYIISLYSVSGAVCILYS